MNNDTTAVPTRCAKCDKACGSVSFYLYGEGPLCQVCYAKKVHYEKRDE